MDKPQEEQAVKKKIGQLQNRQKILLNRKRSEEHRARTHRLIGRGHPGGRFPRCRGNGGRGSQSVFDCPVPSAGSIGGAGRGPENRGRGECVSPRAHLYTVAGVVRPARGLLRPLDAMGAAPPNPCTPARK